MKNLQKNLNQFVTSKFISYGLHLGSLKQKWNPEFKPFLNAFRNKFCLINLNFTLYYLKRALKILLKVVLSGKKILFIGAPTGVEKEFSRLCLVNGHYFLEGGLYGFFTDYKKNRFGDNNSLTKIDQSPALIVLFNPLINNMVLEEIKSLDIPLLAFVNSDDDYQLVDYPVPANVKSQRGGLFVYNLFYHLFLVKKLEFLNRKASLITKKKTKSLKKNMKY